MNSNPVPSSPASGLLTHVKVEYLPLESLTTPRASLRKRTSKQIKALTRSFERFKFINPIVIDRENAVVVGHGRLLAAKKLRLAEVPTIRLEHLTQADCRAYAIADNQLAEMSEWDRDLLAVELRELDGLGIDLTVLGFEVAELDTLLQEQADLADEPPDFDERQAPTTRLGDLWLAGKHRILCGDAREGHAYKALLGRDQAHLVFVDPPYNVKIQGHVSGREGPHEEFVMGSGEMEPDEYLAFLNEFLVKLAEHSVSGSVHYVCMDWRHLQPLLTTASSADLTLLNICVWVKDNGGMGSLYRSRHELVVVFRNGNEAHKNRVQLGKHGRYRTNVWEYPGGSSWHKKRKEELAMHPTVKPVALIADALLDCSDRGDRVLDVFGGSGSTLVAAHRTGRQAFLMELDPRYVDVTIERFQRTTGIKVTLASTGQTYAAVQAERRQHATVAAEVTHA